MAAVDAEHGQVHVHMYHGSSAQQDTEGVVSKAKHFPGGYM